MKTRLKALAILTMIVSFAVFLGGTAWGQSGTLTVCDGNETDDTVPINFTWADTDGTTSEFVIPASDLSAMNGKDITGMTFYVQTLTEAVESGATFKVYMKEVQETTVSSISGPDACTVVYTGLLDMAEGATSLNIEFDDSYGYGGGNLLIGTYVVEHNKWSNATFLGIEASEASIIYANDVLATRNFLPKTTFTYSGSTSYPKPQNLTLDEVATETAELSWTAPSGDVTSYKYQYKLKSASWGDDDETTSTSVSLSGLTAHTGYDFRVKAIYGENESSYATTSFVTDCASTQSLPYAYGFEDADEFTCWTMVDCGSNTKIKDTPHSGDYSFRFGYPDYPQYLISPKFDGTTGVSLSFYYKTYDEDYPETFQVGYSTATDDPDDFAWHDEVTATNSGAWFFYNDNFPTGTKYIAVRYNSDDQYFLYVDDFSFTVATPCPSPTNFAAANITRTTATITWTSDAANFDIQYKKLSSATWTSTTSTTNSCTLEGLESETEYEIQVKAICGGEDGESDWSYSFQFVTGYATPVVIDGLHPLYTDDFEGENLNWKFINGKLTNEWYWGTATNNGGSKAIYVSNDGGNHNTYTKDAPTLVYATKTFTLSKTSYTISYDWKANGEPGTLIDYDYLLVALVPANTVLTASNSTNNPFYQGLPDEWMPLTSTENSMLSGFNVFQNESVQVEIETAGDYKVVFAWRNDDQTTGNDAPAAIDNFRIEMVAKPTELAASPVVTSANITWNPSYENETAWLLYYSTSGDDPYNDIYSGENVIAVSDNPTCNLTGLTSGTTYYVWVRSNFGTRTYSDWTGPVSFTPSATTEVIVNEGGNTSFYIPFDCTNVNNGTMSQFIVHATQLTSIVDKQISKMFFYPDEEDADFGDATFEVYLKEIDNNSFTTEAFVDWGTMTKVYEGALIIENNIMEVVFSTPFAYSDKNILVGFKLKTTGSVQNVLWSGKAYLGKQYGVFSTDDPYSSYSYPNAYYAFGLPTVKFSCDIDYNIFATAGDWNTASNWSKDAVPTSGQEVLIQKAVTIPSTCIAQANTITLDGGSITVEEGGQLICSNSVEVTMQKEIEASTETENKWYAIASPVNNQLFEDVEHLVNASNDPKHNIYRYDEENIEWEEYRDDANIFNSFANGRGYLFRTMDGSPMIEFNGNINVAEVAYTLSYACDNDNFKGFNLIGNPFTHNIYKGTGAAIINEYLEDGFYSLSTDGAWVPATDNDTPIAPAQGILVQATASEEITIANTTADGSSKAGDDQIMFKVENSDYSDVAYVLFKEGHGLNKVEHRNAEIQMLYIINDDENFAIADMSGNTEAINLGFEAKTMGKYTLSLNARGNFAYMHLIDKLTGEDVDMLVENEYSFIGSPSDNANRFIVRLEYAENTEVSETFAYQSGNDIIVIGEGELQVFDVMGRMVATQYVSDVETINVNAQGVYIMKLNEKIQKIVVR